MVTRKARAVYRATCTAQTAPLALPEGSAPSTVPLPPAGWAGCGLRAQLSLSGWPQSGELVRTFPSRAGRIQRLAQLQ